MAHTFEKVEGKIIKNIGKLTGNYRLQIQGAIRENRAKMKDQWPGVA